MFNRSTSSITFTHIPQPLPLHACYENAFVNPHCLNSMVTELCSDYILACAPHTHASPVFPQTTWASCNHVRIKIKSNYQLAPNNNLETTGQERKKKKRTATWKLNFQCEQSVWGRYGSASPLIPPPPFHERGYAGAGKTQGHRSEKEHRLNNYNL